MFIGAACRGKGSRLFLKVYLHGKSLYREWPLPLKTEEAIVLACGAVSVFKTLAKSNFAFYFGCLDRVLDLLFTDGAQLCYGVIGPRIAGTQRIKEVAETAEAAYTRHRVTPIKLMI
ncbi:hypothetical protein B5P22_00340 [Pseudomonas tolaasii]|nr:hypothetical protein B5P22_00340 [Pseudomonas tolaasii]